MAEEEAARTGPDEEHKREGHPLLLRVGAAVVVLVLVAGFKYVPELVATEGLQGRSRAEDLGRSRTAYLAGLAGLLAAVGAFYTHRNFVLGRDQFKLSSKVAAQTHQLDQARQITERFSRAIEHLGTEKSEVQLGGIYALERIARDSPEDHPQVVEVLTAYLRSHTTRDPTEDRPLDWPPVHSSKLPKPPPDVQSVLSVLGRRKVEQDLPGTVMNLAQLDLEGLVLEKDKARFPGADLSDVMLRRAQLAGADLANARLVDAKLEWSFLAEACLCGTSVSGADFNNATLTRADFTKASGRGLHLMRSDLTGAKVAHVDWIGARLDEAVILSTDFSHAILERAMLKDVTGLRHYGGAVQASDETGPVFSHAKLYCAVLDGADLRGADLRNADLCNASLLEVDLVDAKLTDATFDDHTDWPAGFDPELRGARRVPVQGPKMEPGP
jgi:uncharacterized protein YjbI with pentapeptide repeats